jgi:hypothetical protein
MQSVSYQKKVGDWFFTEVSAYILRSPYEAHEIALLSVCLCVRLSLLGNGPSVCLYPP